MWQNLDACVDGHRAAVQEKDTAPVKRPAQLSVTVRHGVVLRDDDAPVSGDVTPCTRSTQKGDEGGAGDHQTTRST